MTWPTIFANLAAGNEPLSLIDGMFTQVAAMIVIPCTAAGSNAITLTPIGNAPTLAAYSQFNSFNFRAAASSTGLVTAQFGSLASLPVYQGDGATQVTSGGIVSGHLYTLVFASQLNGGNGGFYLLQATINPITTPGGSSFVGLQIVANAGNPDTQIDVSFSQLVMINPANGAGVLSLNFGFTINAANVGVPNGLDGGSLQPNTWYYVYGISNGSTIAGLLSLSSTSPTLPAGYTFLTRLGARHTDPNNGNTGTFTVTIATPAVITRNAHGLIAGSQFIPTTTGALPTGMTAGSTYYVIAAGLTANTFEFSATPNGPAINTSGSQSGTHTMTVPATRLQRITQRGRWAQWSLAGLGTSTPVLPLIANGSAGTFGVSPVLVSVSLANIVPPTAAQVFVGATSAWQGGTLANVIVAPNVNWGGTNFGPLGTIGNVFPIWLAAANGNANAFVTMENYGIAWASDNAGGALMGLGWSDIV